MFRTSKAKQLPIQEEHPRLTDDQGERDKPPDRLVPARTAQKPPPFNDPRRGASDLDGF
jgi:hypothetical protein